MAETPKLPVVTNKEDKVIEKNFLFMDIKLHLLSCIIKSCVLKKCHSMLSYSHFLYDSKAITETTEEVFYKQTDTKLSLIKEDDEWKINDFEVIK